MKENLFIFFFITSCNFLFAQTSAIDSLEKVLETQKEDTNKVNTLHTLWQYANEKSDYKGALIYAEKALALSKKINFKKGIAFSHMNIGMTHNASLGSLSESLKHMKMALEIYIEEEDQPQIANCYLSIASTYYYKGSNYAEAIKNAFTALNIFEMLGAKNKIADCLLIISMTYGSQNDLSEALKYSHAAIEILEQLRDSSSLAYNYNNIGGIYLSQGNFPAALESHSKALKIYEVLGNRGRSYGIPWTYGCIGSTYESIGAIAYKKGDRKTALVMYNKALANYKMRFQMETEGNMSHLSTYSNLGSIYLSFSKIVPAKEQAKMLSISKDYFEKDLQLAIKQSLIASIPGIYYNLSVIDSLRKNYEEAYSHHILYILYRDSIFNVENSKKSTMYKMQFDAEKKEALAAAELSRQKLLRNGFIGGFTVVLLFAGVFLMQRNRIKKGKKRSDELLLNILPSEVAEELKEKGTTDAKLFDEVTVLFTDFKNFTAVAEKLSAQELVNEINYCYSEFDKIIAKYGIEKIKTIGDSYMCAGGLPVPNKTNAEDAVRAGLEIKDFMLNEKQKREADGKSFFDTRIGLNTGPVVAGIVGIKKFAYDIWGDTVNIASRMESSGESGKVNISGTTYDLVKDKFKCTHRGKISAKNKGEIDMYFVDHVL